MSIDFCGLDNGAIDTALEGVLAKSTKKQPLPLRIVKRLEDQEL